MAKATRLVYLVGAGVVPIKAISRVNCIVEVVGYRQPEMVIWGRVFMLGNA